MDQPPDPRFAGSIGPAPIPPPPSQFGSPRPAPSQFGSPPPAPSQFGSPPPAGPAFGASPFGTPPGAAPAYGALPPAPQPPRPRRSGRSKLAVGAGVVLGVLALLRVGGLVLGASNAARDITMPETVAGRPDTSANYQDLIKELEGAIDSRANHPTVAMFGDEPILVTAFRNRLDVSGEFSDAGMGSMPTHKHGDISCRTDKSGLTICLDSGLTLSVEAVSASPQAKDDVLVQAIKDVQAAN